jgi:tetratricopeptide (TPR) repeat protein
MRAPAASDRDGRPPATPPPDLEEALDIYRDIGNRGGEVEALNEAGTLCRVSGDLRQAKWYHQQALALAREIGSSWDEAHALAGLGRFALATGHSAEAKDNLWKALQIFRRIGAVDAADVSAELEALTDAYQHTTDLPYSSGCTEGSVNYPD